MTAVNINQREKGRKDAATRWQRDAMDSSEGARKDDSLARALEQREGKRPNTTGKRLVSEVSKQREER